MPAIKFLGASVLAVNSSVGWGSSNSELKVELVEDPTDGDVFVPGTVGGPVTFLLGSMTFRGLLVKYTQDRSTKGYPTYSVIIRDPRHLLEDCKVILSEYRLTTTGIYNLFNVFGYYEAFGFGASNTNSTGMPWEYVKNGLHIICNNPASVFGGPINYRGFTYNLDLNNLPALPSHFRVGGQSHGLSILDFIQICCDAANYDYFIKLVGMTITLSVVARTNAYPLGTISSMINSTFAGVVKRSSVGVEERNEVTSTFLIGENVHSLVKISSNADFEDSFWGFQPVTAGNTNDLNNLIPVVGSIDGQDMYANFYATDPDYYETPSNPTPEVNTCIYSYPIRRYRIYIDSPQIASYVGATDYITNDLELQIILGLGQHKYTLNSWSRYLEKSSNPLYQQISLGNTPANIHEPNGPLIPNNLQNTSNATVTANQAARQGNLVGTGSFRLKAVFDWLSIYAKNYYGKKFALQIPNVYRKIDTDTNKISYSHEVTDGGWVDATDISNDISNLPPEAYNRFKTNDGRFIAFAKYDATNADISRVNKANTYQQPSGSNYLFSKININPQFYFDNNNRAYLIVDSESLYRYPDSIVGLTGVVGPLAITTGIYISTSNGYHGTYGHQALQRLISGATQGSIPLVTHPKPIIPYEFQIPIKSNVLTYGPWWAQGAAGRINYEQDPSLAPWNYGGFAGLNQAGLGKAVDSISYIQVIETGQVEVAALPLYNIGDLIVSNGPNITNISIDLRGEFSTTYRFETYVPRPGQLGKYNRDLLSRNRIAATEMNRKIRSRAELVELSSANTSNARDGNIVFQRELAAGIVQFSPSNMLVSELITDDNGTKFHVVSTAKLEEVVGLIPTGVSAYKGVAAASIESIISPYSIHSTNNTSMPLQETQGGLTAYNDIPNSNTLSPWKDSPDGYTTKYYTKGNAGYLDLNDYNWTTNPGSSTVAKKVFGLRGPLVIVGWGFDLHCNISPSNNYLTDATTWKAGPLDPLWDDYRKVWSVNNHLFGITIDTCQPITTTTGDWDGVIDHFNSCNVAIYKDNVYAGFDIEAYNPTNNEIPAQTWVELFYIPTANKWFLVRQPKQMHTIDYTGNPTFIAAPGYPVFNLIDHTLYISDGELWHKFCPCEEDITTDECCIGGEALFHNVGDVGADDAATFSGPGAINAEEWQAPECVTRVTVECFGSGGSTSFDMYDGYDSPYQAINNGGGGGAYAKSVIDVVPGEIYRALHGFGIPTTFQYGDIVIVKAANGDSPLALDEIGYGGTVAQSIGDIIYPGGNGGIGYGQVFDEDTGTPTRVSSGGGGGGAGPNGAGQDGVDGDYLGWGNNSPNGGIGGGGYSQGGTGGYYNEFWNGSEWEVADVLGEPGENPGGGAGGGGYAGGGYQIIAFGGNGMVRITWTCNGADTGSLYIQGDNTETVSSIDPPSNGSDSDFGQFFIQGDSNNISGWPPTDPSGTNDYSDGQLYIQADNTDICNMDNGDSHIYIQADNYEILSNDILNDGLGQLYIQADNYELLTNGGGDNGDGTVTFIVVCVGAGASGQLGIGGGGGGGGASALITAPHGTLFNYRVADIDYQDITYFMKDGNMFVAAISALGQLGGVSFVTEYPGEVVRIEESAGGNGGLSYVSDYINGGGGGGAAAGAGNGDNGEDGTSSYSGSGGAAGGNVLGLGYSGGDGGGGGYRDGFDEWQEETGSDGLWPGGGGGGEIWSGATGAIYLIFDSGAEVIILSDIGDGVWVLP